MNRETGLAHPAQETLARDLKVDERTIRRLLDILQPLGLTVIPGNGRGMASTYCLDPVRATREPPTEKRTPESTFSDGKGGLQDPPLGQKADSRDTERRTLETAKGGLQSPPNLTKKNQLREPRRKKRASRARGTPPDLASGKGSKGSSEEEKNESSDGFARFWSVYPRKLNEDDARAAFGKAIKGGANIETVVARAACYGVERADAIRNGDNPKWTLYPATWLKKRKYHDPPPPGAVIDQDGNVVAVEQPQQQQSAGRGFASIAEELIAAHVIDPKTGW
jgi:hypothetical protein